ncbi:hypothetical protein FSP39_020283 [Pinctada imbricata]|uniref:Lysosomal cobalamin transporter n=1 Tax=Pinctada imbricata TaxID=66713 RepID=A0AA88Y0K8_PINIB|nr:hypothetical protein FSP39_020283 [Pinctada imbricata]
MSIPSAALAAGWIPFVITLVLILLFATAYVKYFISKYDGTISVTVAAIVAISVTLLTTALIPVDIFLVSYMKTSNGTFQPWAQDTSTRQSLEKSVEYAYYSLYGLIIFCQFLLLPFMYFFFEEKDEETSNKSRYCSALKFTIVFLLIVTVLLLIGAFVGRKDISSVMGNSTSEWNKVQALFVDIANSTRFEDALSFVMSVLSLLGMMALVTYTAYGMSAMPMDFIKGRRSVKSERLAVQKDRSSIRDRLKAMREKYSSRGRNPGRISDLEESEHLMARQEKHLADKESSCLRKCLTILRPFEVIFGVIFILVTLLIFISLLLTNIDKAIHSLGPKLGYALPKRYLPNPVDIVLVFCQQVFPLDYIMFAGIVLYLVVCSMSGIRNIGIWFFWLRMYKIRPRRTRPQGILMLCMILMFMMLAINVIVYELTPQYSSYGSQRYMEYRNSTTGNHTTVTHSLKPCTTEVSSDNCVLSRMSLLLTRFFYQMWFFGAAYYWGTWLFLGFMLIGFLIAVIKKRKSSIDGEVDDDDFDESDDEDMLSA